MNRANETKREGYIRRIENALKTDVTEITHEIFFTEEATREILELLKEPSAEPKTGRCETCKRNADNGGFYDDGRTRCPIQEHYVLLKDGYCHLYELRMRGGKNDKR